MSDNVYLYIGNCIYISIDRLDIRSLRAIPNGQVSSLRVAIALSNRQTFIIGLDIKDEIARLKRGLHSFTSIAVIQQKYSLES